MPDRHEYDAAEARQILGAYAEKKNPTRSSEARETAAKLLLDQLQEKLDKSMADLAAVRQPDGSVAIGFSFGGVRVRYISGRFLVTADEYSKPITVPVVFNRGLGIFEGEEFDTKTNPVPGATKERRRDALAVIVEAVVKGIEAG